jgi:hypothetical protein
LHAHEIAPDTRALADDKIKCLRAKTLEPVASVALDTDKTLGSELHKMFCVCHTAAGEVRGCVWQLVATVE